MRVGLYGGTFDPVHLGHLLLAESAREQCRLDRVRFMPAAMSPHKQRQQPTAAEHRVEMLKLAIGGHGAFEVSLSEIERGGISYTVDTLRETAKECPDDDLFLLLGADSLADLATWKSPDVICELATLVVVGRPGSAAPNFDCLQPFAEEQRLADFVRHRVEMPQIDVSSSDLRDRVAAGNSIRYRTTRAVEKYIETHALYRSGEARD